MSQNINVGVVGCGYWGPNLVRNLSSLKQCTVQAACDRDPKRLAHVINRYPTVKGYANYEHMLKDATIDAVVIATPPHLHFECAQLALKANKHLFIEKPMTTSLKDADALIAMARRAGRVLMVGHTFLYSAPVRKIKEIVDSGDLGEIRYICSRRLNLGLFQENLNVVWDLAPHDLSIICHLMGETPNEVHCCGHAFVVPGVEDATNMSLRFSSGKFAIVHSSWLDPLKVREMTIVGTRRMIVYDDLEPLQKIRIYDTHVETPPHYDTFSQFNFSYHYGDMYAPRIDQRETLQVECEHFIDCIHTGAFPLSGGEAGRDVVQILEAANQSLTSGGIGISIGDQPAAHKTRRRRPSPKSAAKNVERLPVLQASDVAGNGNGNGNGKDKSNGNGKDKYSEEIILGARRNRIGTANKRRDNQGAKTISSSSGRQ